MTYLYKFIYPNGKFIIINYDMGSDPFNVRFKDLTGLDFDNSLSELGCQMIYLGNNFGNNKKHWNCYMAKKLRTIEDEFKKIIITLLEISQNNDCEMVNMGDWSMTDLYKHTAGKRSAVEHLKKKDSKLKDIQDDVLAEAYHEFKALYRIAKEL